MSIQNHKGRRLAAKQKYDNGCVDTVSIQGKTGVNIIIGNVRFGRRPVIGGVSRDVTS